MRNSFFLLNNRNETFTNVDTYCRNEALGSPFLTHGFQSIPLMGRPHWVFYKFQDSRQCPLWYMKMYTK